MKNDIIKFYCEFRYNLRQLAQKFKIDKRTVKSILLKNNIKVLSNKDFKKQQKYLQIKSFYEKHVSIDQTVRKFNRDFSVVIEFFKTFKINDDFILKLLFNYDKNQIIGTRLNSLIENKQEFILQFLKNRFTDSESFTETILRIKNKIHIRPICKECGNKVKFIGGNKIFQDFCCRKCANKNENSKEKVKKTCIEKYGVDNTAKSQQAKQAYRNSMIRKYGVENSFQVSQVIEKARKTKLQKYGSQTFNNRTLSEETCMKKYGVKNCTQNPEIQRRQFHKYSYEGIQFDSIPQMALYFYLKDNNIEFEYQPKIRFKYEFKGRKHFYMPDFLIDGVLTEIKGDHFFKDGKMICPFRDPEWTAEKYEEMCGIYEAKHQCMLKNGVKIMKSENYGKYVDYFKENHKEILKKFK